MNPAVRSVGAWFARRGGLAAAIAAALAAGFLFRAWLGAPAPPDTAQAGGRQEEEVTWTCSMHPQVERDEPGLCPLCQMDLIPRSDLEASAGERAFATSVEAKALMDIQTAPVERRFVEAHVRMVGAIDYDETKLAYITAWAPGRIERMYADFTGMQVRKGDHMVSLYSPELITAQEELRRAAAALERLAPGAPDTLRRTAESTLQAVRDKLRRWGLTESQIDRAQREGKTSDTITIYAPIGGTVIERHGQEGLYVETGERIYAIAGLDELWVRLEAYESDLPWLHYGQKAEFVTESYPGHVFEGTVAFIDPVLDRDTRTVDVRLNIDNPDGALKPGMFVRAVVRSKVATKGRVMDPDLAGKWISPMHPEVVKDEPGACDVCGMPLVPAEELGYVPADAGDADKPLVIPATAPLITGKRAVVYVAQPGADRPTYEGREVVLGPRAGDYYIVDRGLREGERVVTHGNFKIDSALQIAAKPSMMSMEGGPLTTAAVSEELQQELRETLNAYVPVSEALAQDAGGEARAAVKELAAAVSALPARGPSIEGLKQTVDALESAGGIEELRAAFQPVSDHLIAAIRDFGLSEGEPVHVIHCPMAFDFSGADWLQRDQEVRNPYFGSEMFRCGTVEETLAEGAAAPPSAPAGHGGHAHGE